MINDRTYRRKHSNVRAIQFQQILNHYVSESLYELPRWVLRAAFRGHLAYVPGANNFTFSADSTGPRRKVDNSSFLIVNGAEFQTMTKSHFEQQFEEVDPS